MLNPIWNAWYFLSLYANVDGIRRPGPHRRHRGARPLHPGQDRGPGRRRHRAHGRLRPLRRRARSITPFLDALNNWYIRRSRDRFWRARDGSTAVEADKADAYDTLSTVLTTLCTVAAPLLPLLTESVYRGLTGERSVHLTDWPDAAPSPPTPRWWRPWTRPRRVLGCASVRKAKGRRVRLPLRR